MITAEDLDAIARGMAPFIEEMIALRHRVRELEARQAIPGRDGLNGRDGKDGRDGIDGKDGASGLNGKDGAAGLNGKDGAAGLDGKDGANGRDGIDGKAGAPGLHGKDGRDGIDGKDGKDGLVKGFVIEQDGPRSFVYKDPEGAIVGRTTHPVPEYQGVFDLTIAYEPGHVVSYGGSMWIAREAVTGIRPDEHAIEGKRAWTLCVKRGRDGKAGPQGPEGPKGKDGAPGGRGYQ